MAERKVIDVETVLTLKSAESLSTSISNGGNAENEKGLWSICFDIIILWEAFHLSMPLDWIQAR